MSDIATAERLERVLAQLERLGGVVLSGTPGTTAAVDPDGFPGQVAAGELIESAWGNAVVDKLHDASALAAQAFVPGNRNNLASGANAGVTCSLPNVPAGCLLIAFIMHNGATTSASSSFLQAAWTNCTGQFINGPQQGTQAGVIYQAAYIGMGIVTAAGTCTVTYSITTSNASQWMVIGDRSTVSLLALPASAAVPFLLAQSGPQPTGGFA